MDVQKLRVYVDSRLVGNQINDEYGTKDDRMKLYKEEAKLLMEEFESCKIKQIPRGKNKKTDVLSKVASIVGATLETLAKDIFMEALDRRSIEKQVEVNVIVEEEGNTWMTPIIEYLTNDILPEDQGEARKVRMKATQYVMEGGILYRRSYLSPLLRCVGPLLATYVIREVHEGSCGMHVGPRAVVAKIMNLG